MLPTLGAHTSPPVCLPAPAGRSGLEVWRSSAELGRRNSQSWEKESSAEGFHQLHGSIVLEGGRRQGHVTTPARREGATEGGSPTQPPARTLPSPHLASLHSAQHYPPGALANHTSSDLPGTPLEPFPLGAAAHQPKARSHVLTSRAYPGHFRQTGGLKAWP